MTEQAILQARDLDFYYGQSQALKHITMDIPACKATALIGPSGCGKSTFLRTINRMNDLVEGTRVAGSLTFHGQEIYSAGQDVTALRRQIGMVFQKPNPFPMSIYDNVAYGPRTHGERDRRRLDELVESSLRSAAIWDEVKDRLKKSTSLRRTAAASVHRQGPGGGAGGTADGRGHQRPGPHLHGQDRGSDRRAQGALHHCHGDTQYAAGRPDLRPDRLFPGGGAGGVQRDGAAVLHAPGPADGGLHHREVWVMRSRFDQQLERLHLELTRMGAQCEQAIAAGIKALLEDDDEMAGEAIAIEREIDQQEREIESLCMKLLLQQQPVARDLRMVSSALKMISDMERIGDQAADIAEITRHIGGAPLPGQVRLKEMAQAAAKMVAGSVDAFVKRDLNLAGSVIQYDDVVDELFVRIKEELTELIRRDASSAEEALDLLMIAKYLERIGDHAVNLAEWVEYSITGNKK